MAAFNVTALTDLGYDEKTSFIDPMEARYRNKFFSASDLTSRSGDFSESAIEAKVKFFYDLDAYRNKAGVESALEQYWKTKVTSSTVSTKGSTPTTLQTVASSPAAVAASSSTPAAAAAPSGTSAAAAAPVSSSSDAAAPVSSSSDAPVVSPSAA